MSPSAWLRNVLARALDGSVGQPPLQADGPPCRSPAHAPRVRLQLRLAGDAAASLARAASRAGMPLGDFVADLAAGVPAVAEGGSRPHQIATLTASCAELSTLNRQLAQLLALTRQQAAASHEQRPTLTELTRQVGETCNWPPAPWPTCGRAAPPAAVAPHPARPDQENPKHGPGAQHRRCAAATGRPPVLPRQPHRARQAAAQAARTEQRPGRPAAAATTTPCGG